MPLIQKKYFFQWSTTDTDWPACPGFVTGSSSTLITPSSARFSPEIALKSVVFPQPEGPINDTKEPGLIVRFTSFNALRTVPSGFSKDLETFRRDFLNLKNEDVVTVFQRETGEDIEIMGAFEAYKKLPQDLKKQLETEIFKSGKVNPQTNINIDTYKFKSGKERKCPIEERRKLSED